MEQEDEMKPIVYVYNVCYADDIESGAKIMDNLMAQGITEIHATQEENGVYRIEYKVPRKEDE